MMVAILVTCYCYFYCCYYYYSAEESALYGWKTKYHKTQSLHKNCQGRYGLYR